MNVDTILMTCTLLKCFIREYPDAFAYTISIRLQGTSFYHYNKKLDHWIIDTNTNKGLTSTEFMQLIQKQYKGDDNAPIRSTTEKGILENMDGSRNT